MFKPANLENVNQKYRLTASRSQFFYKLGGGTEVIAIILLWAIIFWQKSDLGGLNFQEIITYLIVGSIIGLTTNHLLQRIVIRNLSRERFADFMQRPFTHIRGIFTAGFGQNFLPFVASVILHIALLYFFVDNLFINLDFLYWVVIILMIILAFITELLLVHFFHLFIFWSIESSASYKFAIRLKKFFAGAYFPLSLLPVAFVNVSLAMPFAYSFFVPTELYLKKIDLSVGVRGLGIQVVWILALYVIIKIAWTRKMHKQKLKPEEIKIDNN